MAGFAELDLSQCQPNKPAETEFPKTPFGEKTVAVPVLLIEPIQREVRLNGGCEAEDGGCEAEDGGCEAEDGGCEAEDGGCEALLGGLAGGVDGVDAATASAGTAQHVDAEGVLVEGGPVQQPPGCALLLGPPW